MTDANLDGLPDRTLATGTKWELVTMSYDAFGRLVSTNHIYADGATAGDCLRTRTFTKLAEPNLYDFGSNFILTF